MPVCGPAGWVAIASAVYVFRSQRANEGADEVRDSFGCDD
jgi:hypothetical protein